MNLFQLWPMCITNCRRKTVEKLEFGAIGMVPPAQSTCWGRSMACLTRSAVI